MLSRSDHHEESNAMADLEQVERLKRSVIEWNAWRREYPDRRPDLSRTDLSGANLMGANLKGANLSGANLSRARINFTILSRASLRSTNLSHAILNYTILNHANLSFANLSNTQFNHADLNHAILYAANFSNASLSSTDLSHTYLSYANLCRAHLNFVDLTQAHFLSTLFAKIDLNLITGLDTVRHRGPSTVDLNSVILPHHEQTRLHFLRGVGLTQTQIDALSSSFTPRPKEHHALFISYANSDEAAAKRLHTNLRQNHLTCWLAPHESSRDNYFRERSDQAIHAPENVLLLLSESSVKSEWIRYEVEIDLIREKRQRREILFPLRLDDAVFHCGASWATSLQATRHIGDFTGWQDEATYQQAFTTLLQHLKVLQLRDR